MSTPRRTPDAPKKNRSDTIAALVLLGLVVVGFIWAGIAWGDDPPKPLGKYEATIVNQEILDPTSLRVAFDIKNVSNVTDYIPDCTVQVSNDAGTFSGTKTGSPRKTIAPGATERFNDVVVVTNNGAQYITKGSVSCY